jgi:hypothetical protein
MMNKGEMLPYVLLALAVGLLGFSFLSLSRPKAQVAFDSYGGLANTPQNSQYYQAAAASAGSECGDLNDPANLQHLSHHPDRFQSCYRLVDPAKFKAAVGRDVSEFMR